MKPANNPSYSPLLNHAFKVPFGPLLAEFAIPHQLFDNNDYDIFSDSGRDVVELVVCSVRVLVLVLWRVIVVCLQRRYQYDEDGVPGCVSLLRSCDGVQIMGNSVRRSKCRRADSCRRNTRQGDGRAGRQLG